MAVDHELGTRVTDHRLEEIGVGEGAPEPGAASIRRMVDHHDPHKALPGASAEEARAGFALPAPEPPGGNERRRRHRGGEADQGDAATHAKIGKGRGAGIVRRPRDESRGKIRHRCPHISIVIAGNEAYVMRGPERLQPGPGERVFSREANVQNVTGHSDVIGVLRLDVGDERGENVHVMDERAAACPIEIAGEPLADKLPPARPRQRADMRVGQMREDEAHLRALRTAIGDRIKRCR